jgi:hypothetical protein
MMTRVLSAATYDGQLSGTAYWVVGVMLVIIFGGLSWCLYRALKAGGGAAEEQLPDEV